MRAAPIRFRPRTRPWLALTMFQTFGAFVALLGGGVGVAELFCLGATASAVRAFWTYR